MDMKTKIVSLLVACIVLFSTAHAQLSAQDSLHRKFFVGSTMFLLYNLTTKNPPGFVQFSMGYPTSLFKEPGLHFSLNF